MIRLQVVVVDLAIVKMVYPRAIVMILPQAMMMDFSVMDVMPGVKPAPIVQMMAIEMPGIITRVRPAVIPFPVIAATGKEENAGNQDQDAAKNSHDVPTCLNLYLYFKSGPSRSANRPTDVTRRTDPERRDRGTVLAHAAAWHHASPANC
jgi:hypothetical protein